MYWQRCATHPCSLPCTAALGRVTLFWLYFINEQVLRFLNLRYPRFPHCDFWLTWVSLFPWSVYLPAIVSSFRSAQSDRAGRTRLLALGWVGFVLVFFTFSTTQEYYSMPCYPARLWAWQPKENGFTARMG